jgi:DNA/RNA-binding domain of Phe-tRNA-synthetase-like protein
MSEAAGNDGFGIAIDEAVRSRVPTLFVETRAVRGVRVEEGSGVDEERIAALAAQWAGNAGERLDSHPRIAAYRELTRRLGGDPDEMLPAAEALLKRGLLSGKFPRINPVVDAGNVVSVEYLVPIGLFDLDRIAGEEIELALAGDGERMVPIGKGKPVKLRPGTPVLRDVEGVFSAVGSRDSARTIITADTDNVLVFSWGMEGVEPGLVSSALDECVEAVRKK